MSASLPQPVDFSCVVLSESRQIKKYLDLEQSSAFDVILLDRDCKAKESFHILNVNKFGADKIIAISSVPEYNSQLKKRGVTRAVWKNYQDLDKFADKVTAQIREIVCL